MAQFASRPHVNSSRVQSRLQHLEDSNARDRARFWNVGRESWMNIAEHWSLSFRTHEHCIVQRLSVDIILSAYLAHRSPFKSPRFSTTIDNATIDFRKPGIMFARGGRVFQGSSARQCRQVNLSLHSHFLFLSHPLHSFFYSLSHSHLTSQTYVRLHLASSGPYSSLATAVIKRASLSHAHSSSDPQPPLYQSARSAKATKPPLRKHIMCLSDCYQFPSEMSF